MVAIEVVIGAVVDVIEGVIVIALGNGNAPVVVIEAVDARRLGRSITASITSTISFPFPSAATITPSITSTSTSTSTTTTTTTAAVAEG